MTVAITPAAVTVTATPPSSHSRSVLEPVVLIARVVLVVLAVLVAASPPVSAMASPGAGSTAAAAQSEQRERA
ncbi:hypothetical protein [Streptomyces sp. NPDC127084]|uniref:hypothetical protein n=1 Tax=Streptomyces sp. NPDC127084 TaxID=3347133 RepID=UPI00365888C1